MPYLSPVSPDSALLPISTPSGPSLRTDSTQSEGPPLTPRSTAIALTGPSGVMIWPSVRPGSSAVGSMFCGPSTRTAVGTTRPLPTHAAVHSC
ncbi:hypothetical protein BJF90_06430 [Pseudonocardia sp. CNS-004]|nr:hypothetical protein BJF90_06430 [Pseudonocardia sp. CNS-004]